MNSERWELPSCRWGTVGSDAGSGARKGTEEATNGKTRLCNHASPGACDRNSIWDSLRSTGDWPIGNAALLNVVMAAFYGFVMGSYRLTAHDGWKQALSSAAKVPCLFLLTLVICLPALYVVSSLLGSSLTLRQLAGILMASFLVTTMLLAGFAPIPRFSCFRLGIMHSSSC